MRKAPFDGSRSGAHKVPSLRSGSFDSNTRLKSDRTPFVKKMDKTNLRIISKQCTFSDHDINTCKVSKKSV